jgi:hypothetical protein
METMTSVIKTKPSDIIIGECPIGLEDDREFQCGILRTLFVSFVVFVACLDKVTKKAFIRRLLGLGRACGGGGNWGRSGGCRGGLLGRGFGFLRPPRRTVIGICSTRAGLRFVVDDFTIACGGDGLL